MTKTIKKVAVILCAFIFAVCSLPVSMLSVKAATVTPHFEFKLDGIAVSVTSAGVASTSYATTYDGIPKQPVVSDVIYVSSDGSKTSSSLQADNDYTVTYGSNTNADSGNTKSGTVTVKGAGTYTGTTTTVSFSIRKATPEITLIGDTSITKDYDGNEIQITEGTNYTVSTDLTSEVTYSNLKTGQNAPVDAGSYTATIKVTVPEALKNNYASASVTKTLPIQINRASIEGATVTLAGEEAAGYAYTGSQIKPAVSSVKLNGHTLTSGTDYNATPRYGTNTTAGSTGYVYIDAKSGSNYTGTAAKSFQITPAAQNSIEGAVITINGIKDGQPAEFAYTGNPITPSVTVKINGKTLSSSDYTVSYADNVAVGNNTAKIIVTGRGNYSPQTQVEKTFTIKANAITSASIQAIADQEYTGEAIKPKITVKVGGQIVNPEYYSVSYSNNINAGVNTAVVTVTAQADTQGIVKYTGRGEKTFTIKPHQIKNDDVEISDTATYTSSNVYPASIRVYKNSTSDDMLTQGTDYTVSYTNNVNVGTATCTIKGKAPNYTGTVSKTFQIVNGQGSIDISSATISSISDQIYTGNEIKPGISVSFNGMSISSSNYDVKYFSNVNAGQAVVYIYGKGKYTGSARKTFLIKPANISSASVSGLPAQKYTGYAIQPIPTSVTFGGKNLSAGKDYTLGYESNINKGTGYVILYGAGNFTGSKKVAFCITDTPEKEKVWATDFSLNDTYTVTAGGTVTLTPATAPSNANKYTIRWETSDPNFVFIDGNSANTAQTTDSTGAILRAGTEGSTTITATLYDADSKEIAKRYALVKVIREFSDVPDAYYRNAVNTLANYGYTTGSAGTLRFHSTPVINGTSATTFTPNGDVKRCDFVLMLYNKAAADYAAGKTTTNPADASASAFSDVDSSAYYAKAVSWASANGITDGKGNNTFDPNGTVTRAEAVTFLQRYLKGTSASSTRFSDVSAGSYYTGAVGWAVNAGITNGTTTSMFSPNNKCSRAQAATFIYRAAW